jgi:hypothetical protein
MALAGTIAAAALVTLFVWAATQQQLRDVPIGLVAPDGVAEQITDALEAAAPGAFAIQEVGDGEEAREMIWSRDLYGALVFGEDRVYVRIASGASPAVAQVLTQLPARLQAAAAETAAAGGLPVAPGAVVVVEEVAGLGAGDLTGAGFGSLVIPLAVSGLLLGALVAITVAGRAARVAACAIGAVGIGLVGAALAEPWLEVLPGWYPANAGVIAAGAAAVSLAVVGAHSLLGRLGVPLVVVVVFVIGNPFSGAAAGPIMLPPVWAEIGQALPPGALAAALRSTAYFDGTGVGWPLAILGAWAVAGALLVWVGKRGRVSSPGAGLSLNRSVGGTAGAA